MGRLNGREIFGDEFQLMKATTLQSNWGTSQSLNKATPGKVNSITPKNYDLKIISFKPEKDFAVVGEPVSFQIKIKNAGLTPPNNFQIQFYKDLNKDSIAQSNELISSLIRERYSAK